MIMLILMAEEAAEVVRMLLPEGRGEGGVGEANGRRKDT